MRSSLALVVASALLLLCLSSLPSSLSAQPVPTTVYPDGFFHAWSVVDFDFDPNAPVVYVIDDGWQVVGVNTTDGRPIRAAYYAPPNTYAQHIAVNSKSQVYVTLITTVGGPFDRYFAGAMLVVLDAQLRPVRNVSMASLKPASNATQLVIDSADYVYLFSEWFVGPTNPTVWVLEPRNLVQADAWKANIPLPAPYTANYTDYLLAIDNTDLLYFQQVTAARQTFLFTVGSDYVTTLDLLGPTSNYDYDEDVTDLAIDAKLNLYFTRASSYAVDVFDTNGRRQAPLFVLNGPSLYYEVPLLDIDRYGYLQVYDPLENIIAAVSADGFVVRSFGSEQANTRRASELFIDQSTGDLLVGYPSEDLSRGDLIIAQRLRSRNGELVQTYELPSRLRNCISTAFDVGGRNGHLYTLLVCNPYTAYQTYRLHVLQASGRVQAEFLLPYGGYRLRVDEFAQRIYIADNTGRESKVQVLDMQGRNLSTITTQGPALGYLSDLLVEPGMDGGELVVLDASNGRVVHFFTNGSLAYVIQLERSLNLWDLAFAGRGEVYVSATSYYYSNTVGWSYNSSIVHYNRRGETVERFVGWGDQLQDGPELAAIAISQDNLFAIDFRFDAIFAWSLRTDQPAEAAAAVEVPQVKGEGEAEEVAVKWEGQTSGDRSQAPSAGRSRHALMKAMGTKFARRR